MPSDEEYVEDDLAEMRYKFHTDGGDPKQPENVSDVSISEDEALTRVDRMAEEIQHGIDQ